MRYCEICRKNNNWPVTMEKAHLKCEICGPITTCYNKEDKFLHGVDKYYGD